jgi:hypothetical protein
MLWAEYMHRIGLIKQKPASWKDYQLPDHPRPEWKLSAFL